jgi:hypothetical protein
MSRARKQRHPQYLSRLLQRLAQAQSNLKRGELYTIDVLHDDWCLLLKGKGPCNCNPDVRDPERVPSPEEN